MSRLTSNNSTIEEPPQQNFKPGVQKKELDKVKETLVKMIEDLRDELIDLNQKVGKVSKSFDDKLDRSQMINFEAEMKNEIEKHGKAE